MNYTKDGVVVRLKYNKCKTLLFLSASVGTFLFSSGSYAKEYFNPHLLETTETSVPPVDLSLFSEESVPPGEYNLDVYINGAFIDSGTIPFKLMGKGGSDDASVLPCLTIDQLKKWNVAVDNYPDLAKGSDSCANLSAIPESTIKIKMANQRLELTFPQVAMLRSARGYVPEEKWDDGINAGLLNYNLSGQTSTPRNGGASTNSQFVSLQPGINLGPWRLRNYSTYNHDDERQQWDSVYSTISRDIRALKSQLTIGESNTTAGVFDSQAFTGAQLSSDVEMLPDSMQGFAPVIRGIARSNAEVTVYQNGYNIYKTTVPPGAFEINDMYPTGSSGDLHVVVKESDGSEQSFIVPYASLAVLQRPGQMKYAVSAGKTRASDSRVKEFNFIQSSMAYGLLDSTTLYGGFQQAEDKYTNLLIGTGLNLGTIGAVSVDVSQAWAQIKKSQTAEQTDKESGQSYRIRFSKDFPQTGTDISVAGYRYSTSGYYSLDDFTDTYSSYDTDYHFYNAGRQRNRFDATLSQNTAYGSVNLSLVSEAYWDRSRTDSISVGYSNSWNNISYFMNYSYNHNVAGGSGSGATNNDSTVSLTVSVPFSIFSHNPTYSSINANYNVSGSKNGPTVHNVGLNGLAFDDNSLNWQVQEGYTSDTRKTSGNVNASYQGSKGNITGGYGYDQYNERFNYGLQGGMVAHSGGVTLSRSLNETVALVQAPGIQDAPINGQINIHTDSWGNAVVPYVRPYHENMVNLDGQQMADRDADIENVTKTVVPTRGAVVRARYQTYLGYRAMMTLSYQNKPVPFGAIVTSANDSTDGDMSKSNIVGEDGQVYLAGLQDKGVLLVKWGDGSDQQCHVNYSLNPQPNEIAIVAAPCVQ